MFNLFRSGGKGVKIMFTGMLLLLAASMLLYLVPTYDDGQVSGDVILQVGDRKITVQEAQVGYERYTQGRIPPEMMAVYFPQYIEEMKYRYAAVEQARQMGITATDTEVIDVLAQNQNYAPFFKDGKLVRRAELEAALASQGATADTLFGDIKDEVILTKMRDAIAESTVITPQELQEEYKRKYDRATVDFIAFSDAELRSKAVVTDADIQKEYETKKATLTQPEKYSFRVLVLTQDRLAASLQINEQELRTQYAGAIDNFRTPEQVHARHILLGTDGKSDAEKKTLRDKAEGLAKQARSGSDFAELAKKNSEDSGNASLGGDLGTFAKGQNAKEFDDAAFAMKPGEVSGVVTTQFGYHIIQVVDRIPSKVTPFEQVRAEIEREYRASKVAETMDRAKTQLSAELTKNPAGAAELAKKLNADLITVTEATASDAIPTLGVAPEIGGVLPTLMPNGVSSVLSLPGERAAIAILDKKIPGRPATLEESRAGLRERLLDLAAAKLMQDNSKEAIERLKKGEEIHAIAAALGGKVEGASNFAIGDTIPALGTGVQLGEAFTKPVGSVIGPTLVQGRSLVSKIVSRTEADMNGLAAEKGPMMAALKAARARENDRIWMDSIVKRLTDDGDLTVNNEALQTIVGQLSRN